jgi:hypothetical protein
VKMVKKRGFSRIAAAERGAEHRKPQVCPADRSAFR